MPNKRSLCLALLLLWFASAAWAEVTAYYRTAWTGNTVETVDGITTPGNGDFCIVNGTIDGIYKVCTVHRFNASSAANESGIENIDPDDETPGKWELHQPAYCFGTIEPSITAGVVWFDTSAQ